MTLPSPLGFFRTLQPPAAPTGMTITAVGCNSFDYQFTDASETEDQFNVYWRKQGDPWPSFPNQTHISFSGTGSTVSGTASGLVKGTTYEVKATAENSAGESGDSNTASDTTDDDPAAPSNVAFSQPGENQVSVTWTENDTNWDQFRIERGERPNGGTYSFLANDADGSPYTDTDFGTHLDTPSGFSATPASDTQVDLSWTNGATVGDEIAIWRDGVLIDTIATSNTSYSDTGLNPDTTYSYEIGYRESQDYQYRVRAENTCGNSTYDESLQGTVTETGTKASDSATTDEAPPSAPTNLVADPVDTDQVDLTWDDVSNEDEYRIERESPAGSGSWSEIDTVGAGVTSYSDTGRSADTEYNYRVLACNTGGCSGYSNEDAATTWPVAPKNISATQTDSPLPLCGSEDAHIDVTWDVGTRTGSQLTIERDDNSSFSSPTTLDSALAAGTESYTDTISPSDGSTYYYRVKFNDESPEQWSATASEAADCQL